MKYDSLITKITNDLFLADTTQFALPHGGKVPAEVGTILVIAGLVAVACIAGLIYLGFWAAQR